MGYYLPFAADIANIRLTLCKCLDIFIPEYRIFESARPKHCDTIYIIEYMLDRDL